MSVIIFSVLAGAGYGLWIWLGLALGLGICIKGSNTLLVPLSTGFMLVSAGLLASTLHLGKPWRGWRGFTQWRSSWLSREALAAILTYVPMMILVTLRHAARNGLAVRGTGLVLAACALLTVYCTARIYTSLKPIPAWHLPQVLPGFVLLALASGAVWLWLILALPPQASICADSRAGWLTGLILLLAATTWLKRAYWHNMDHAAQHVDAGTATGLGHLGKLRGVEAPHSEANYLLHEMGFVMARTHSLRLRKITLLMGFVLPLSLLGVSILVPLASAWAAPLAVFSLMCALFMERWLFFAEARHHVVAYYPDHG